MATLGAFCFPGTGHINPMTALARRLQLRGHEVVLFGIADVEAAVTAAGVRFCRIGDSDYPTGTLKRLDDRLAQLNGLRAFHFTVDRVRNTARMILREGPSALRDCHVDAVLVDEADMAGNVAEYMRLPYVSVAFFPPLMQHNRVPPFCFGWRAGQDGLSRLRNQLGMRLLTLLAAPVLREVNRQRETWGLKPLARLTDTLSPLAQVAQMPEALEFDCGERPEVLHYTGPFIDAQQRPAVAFPWERLDGRPVIYASMGTLQNGAEKVFRTIAEACVNLDAQLVISLGGGLSPERLGRLPGDPIVVGYAPQLQLLKRAAAVITHAGLNTTLESLTEGVPMVCIPMGNDQPGVAARVAAKRAGMVIPLGKLSVRRLRGCVQAVLEDSRYGEAARGLQEKIVGIDGPGRAADVIEAKLGLARQPSVHPAMAAAKSKSRFLGFASE
ncbi:MAG TPA: nucleotide disphospho-sugar-binding domain-containing protein [Bryocella sp.]|nr:nucleotide disphospho-sugar-binding domain-containing protein [Bryocella sp.]